VFGSESDLKISVKNSWGPSPKMWAKKSSFSATYKRETEINELQTNKDIFEPQGVLYILTKFG